MARTKNGIGPGDNVGFLLAQALQHVNALLTRRFAERGFPEVRASYGSVLVPLFESDGLRLGELAAASRLSKQAMTGLVQRCEADGLVERERNADDGRAFTIRLSARGREFRAAADEVLTEFDALLAESLGPRNRDALMRALKGVMQL